MLGGAWRALFMAWAELGRPRKSVSDTCYFLGIREAHDKQCWMMLGTHLARSLQFMAWVRPEQGKMDTVTTLKGLSRGCLSCSIHSFMQSLSSYVSQIPFCLHEIHGNKEDLLFPIPIFMGFVLWQEEDSHRGFFF